MSTTTQPSRNVYLLEVHDLGEHCRFFIYACQNVDIDGAAEDDCTVEVVRIQDGREGNSTIVGSIPVAQAKTYAIARAKAVTASASLLRALQLALRAGGWDAGNL